MKVITHKIFTTEVKIARTLAVLPTEAVERVSISLPLDEQKMNRGQSLSNAIKPVIHCDNGRRLRWWEATSKTEAELDMDYWNQLPVVSVPFAEGGLVPYSEVQL